MADVLSAMEANRPSDQSSAFIVFSPIFGEEALKASSHCLMNLGFSYFDDFFEFVGFSPAWCQVGFFSIEQSAN